jgi:hypothetical protein
MCITSLLLEGHSSSLKLLPSPNRHLRQGAHAERTNELRKYRTLEIRNYGTSELPGSEELQELVPLNGPHQQR